MEKASSENLCLVSLIWHPWSLATFDLEMNMLEYAFSGTREIGLSRVPMPTCHQHLPGQFYSILSEEYLMTQSEVQWERLLPDEFESAFETA